MTLADRYRRLLAWYPKDHRERHGEEMLDVLLAGAGDRERPSRKETVDVLRGALRLHLRRMTGADGGIDHRDVLAIVSLLGPIVILAGAVTVVETMHPMLLRHPILDPRAWLIMAPEAPWFAMWSVVAVLSLFRLRKTAAAGAWLTVLMFPPLASISYRLYWNHTAEFAGWLLLGLLIATALTWSPGPARGWELVGRRRVVVLAAAVVVSVLLVLKSFGDYVVLSMPLEWMVEVHGAFRMSLWFLALAVLVAGALVAGGVRTREGRHAALMLSVPVMVGLVTFVLPKTYDAVPAAVAICYAVPVAVVLVFGGLPRRARVRA
jgi:hypothetical protein